MIDQRNPVDCPKAWQLIERVCAEGLPGPVALALRRHLASCVDCHARYRERVRSTAELSRSLAARGVDVAPAASVGDRRLLRRRRAALTFAVACALIAAVARLDGDWNFDPTVRIEWLAGEVWAGGERVGPDSAELRLERSDLVLTDDEGRARVRSRDLELELEPGVRLLVISATGQRLRLERGRLLLRGEGQLETPRGVVVVDEGEAEVSLEADQLEVVARSGRVERIDARGTTRVEPSPTPAAG